jgi:hypothetical protein
MLQFFLWLLYIKGLGGEFIFRLPKPLFWEQDSMSMPKKEHDELLTRGLGPGMRALQKEARRRLRQQERRKWAQRNLDPQKANEQQFTN